MKCGFWLSVCLLLASCRGGGSGGDPRNDLELLGTNFISGQSWPINKALEFSFNKTIELESVTFASLGIDPQPAVVEGAPLAEEPEGFFFLAAGSDGKTVGFQPFCATGEDDKPGLIPGNQIAPVTYSIVLSSAIRAEDGATLRENIILAFQTPAPPDSAFEDPVPATPPEVMSEGLPSSLGLNLFINPINPVSVTLDQPVLAESIDSEAIQLFYDHPRTGQRTRLPADVVLLENCTLERQAVLSVIPQGILPPNTEIDFLLGSEVTDLGNQKNGVDLSFHKARVTPSTGNPQRDAILEEFDLADQEDTNPPFLVPRARWDEGGLEPAPLFPPAISRPDIEIGPGTTNGPAVTFDTDGGSVRDTDGNVVFFADGVIRCHNFTMRKANTGTSKLLGIGSRPLIIEASGQIMIGTKCVILVDGADGEYAEAINLLTVPSQGGIGQCGGGRGGNGSPQTTQSSDKGDDGLGAFNIGNGGAGGHSCHGGHRSFCQGAGGGGGNWGILERDPLNSDAWVAYCYAPSTCTELDCQADCPDFNRCDDTEDALPPTRGESGTHAVDDLCPDGDCLGGGIFTCYFDAHTGQCTARGGQVGPSLFIDEDPANNFMGRKPIQVGEVITGELTSERGGQGGGGGGDSVASLDFPSPDFPADEYRGGAGGGGGGILILRSFGPMDINGILSANGGDGGGGEALGGDDLIAGGGGGAAGGMIILESATGVLLRSKARIRSRGGDRGPAKGDSCRKNDTLSKGGAGGKGLTQIHVPYDSTATVSCEGFTRPSLQAGSLQVMDAGVPSDVTCERDSRLTDLFDPDPYVLIPGFGTASAARSQWYFLGATDLAGEGASFAFGGIDPVTGELDGGNPFVERAAGSGGALDADRHAILLNDAALIDHVRSEPAILRRNLFEANQGAVPVEIAQAEIEGNALVLYLDPLAPLEAPGNWRVLERFWQVRQDGSPVALPADLQVRIEFEGALETFPGSAVPDTTTIVGPTTDLSQLENMKFLRYSIFFQMLNIGPDLPATLPARDLDFVKTPFAF